jgi:hypothetical protein
MAILYTDILWKLSTTAGVAGDSTAQADPDASLGKYVSTSEWAGSNKNDLFDDISPAEDAAATADYRCLFIHNNHATLSLLQAKAWVSAQVTGGANVSIGLDATAATAKGASGTQAYTIANETAAPTGVVFSTPTSALAGIELGDIPAGYVKAIWVKRLATNSGAQVDDGATLGVYGSTEV